MIRFIAALDRQNGIADNHGIPWKGKLPTDVSNLHDKIKTGMLLMGFGMYKELNTPYPGGTNYVATTDTSVQLQDGFAPVSDARKFLKEAKGDVWNLGGALLFSSTLDLADELYLTRIDQDFHCTKFFPDFEQNFELVSHSEAMTENGITFHFETWKRKAASS